jgi:hypothetical protein
MNFDYTIDSLISKNFAEIEIEFSKLLAGENYEEINAKFEGTLKDYRKKIENHLRKYDSL